jgi:glycosyltransferase involved in cell wall biosynthesis
MRILYLTDEYPPENKGGAGVIVYRLANAVAELGHNVAVVAQTSRFKEIKYETVGKTAIFWLPATQSRNHFKTGLKNVAMLKMLEPILRDFKPDVVHAHNLHWQLSYAAIPLAKRFAKKVFFTTHDTMPLSYAKVYPPKMARQTGKWDPRDMKLGIADELKSAFKTGIVFRSKKIKRYLLQADMIFAVSDTLAGCWRANDYAQEKICALHNGIDVAGYNVDTQDIKNFKATKGIVGKKIVMLGGRVGIAKGVDALIEAMPMVQKRCQNAALAITASEEAFSAIQGRAKARNIDASLINLGWLDAETSLKLAYASSAIIASPSLYLDPFPTVNLEAMASKKPVVGTCFGGTPEAVQDGVTGYIVNPYDTRMLAERICDLLNNPAKAEAFGQAGYKRVMSDFSMEKNVEEHLAWYEGGKNAEDLT